MFHQLVKKLWVILQPDKQRRNILWTDMRSYPVP
jgi:hypothetical protein